jgi:hypothetical protein
VAIPVSTSYIAPRHPIVLCHGKYTIRSFTRLVSLLYIRHVERNIEDHRARIYLCDAYALSFLVSPSLTIGF